MTEKVFPKSGNKAGLSQSIEALQNEVKLLHREALKFKKNLCLANMALKRLLRSMPMLEQEYKPAWQNNVPPKGALRDPRVQKLVIDLRRQGATFEQITIEANAMISDQEKRLSKSAIHRFYTKAKRGGYRAFGVEGWQN